MARDFWWAAAVHYFWHYVANRMLTLLSDIFTNLKLTDMETCYKVFRERSTDGDSGQVEQIWIRTGDYGQDRKSTSGASTKCRLVMRGALTKKEKKITWKDGIQALWCIIRYKFTD